MYRLIWFCHHEGRQFFLVSLALKTSGIRSICVDAASNTQHDSRASVITLIHFHQQPFGWNALNKAIWCLYYLWRLGHHRDRLGIQRFLEPQPAHILC